jgi:hypothetical protein
MNQMSYLRQNNSSNPLLLQAARNLIERKQQAVANDPVELARRASIEPDAWQAEVLRSKARQTILLCSRQAGKSTVTSLLALHQAIYTPNSLVLLLAPALRQSQELFRKLRAAQAALLPLPVEVEEESALRTEYANGSRIICLPGKEATIRGFSGVSLLVVDEASRVPDALYASIRPMLAVSGGRIVLLSTPFGKRGFFSQEWHEGGKDWHRAKITAYDCPRIPKDWLDTERRAIGSWWFRQEYLCEFLDSIDQVFATEDIERAIDDSIKPLFGGSI